MGADRHGAGAPPGAASLRSGRDWAAWLQQARPESWSAAGRPSGEQLISALTALAHLARRLGFAVERGGPGDRAGMASWATRRIQIPAGLAADHAAAALAHQLGHVLLHEQAGRLSAGGIVQCSGLRKVEADSVAYLTAVHLGTDTAAITFPYIASWAGTDPRARPAATIEAAASRVLAAAATITAHLDSELLPGRQPCQAVRRGPEPSAGPRPSRVPSAPGLPAVPGSDIVQVNAAAQAFFRGRLAGSWVPGYLASRGLGPDVQELWGAGHAPASWDALTRHLRALGCGDRLLEAAGLARRSRRGTLIDVFRNRATLPVRSPDGTIIAFIGRAHPRPADGTPKYLNSPQTSLYDKSTTLFGFWEARETLAAGAQPVIVEGPLDAIAVTTAGDGRYAGLAPCGTALTTPHAGILASAADLEATGILVAFDADQAGRRAAVRTYHLLSQLTTDTAAAVLPAGHDPAQILAGAGPESLAAMLGSSSQPLADLVTDAQLEPWARWLDHPHGQASALRAAAPVIAAMPPAHVARQIARLSELLTLDYAAITDAVTSAVPEVIRRGSAGGEPASGRPGESGDARSGGGHGPASPDQPARPTSDGGQPVPRRGPPGALSRIRRPESRDLPIDAAGEPRPVTATMTPAGRTSAMQRGPRSSRRSGWRPSG
jgi:DNA primase